MIDKSVSDRITETEYKIATLLAELERDVDMLVVQVEIKTHEVTQVDSVRQEFARRVQLRLQRRPGSHWATGGTK